MGETETESQESREKLLQSIAINSGVTRNSSNQFRELPETPPINSNQFVSFKNKGLARPSARSPPPACLPRLASPRHAHAHAHAHAHRHRLGPGRAGLGGGGGGARARACGIQVILFYFSNGSANDQVFK